jgi:hypothetical protein
LDFKYPSKFQALLYDLAVISDDYIIGNIEFELTILAMKYSFKDMNKHIDYLVNKINRLEKINPGIKRFFTLLFRYIIGTSEELSTDEIITKITSGKLKEVIMTVEQKLIEKGMEKGIEKGERKKAIETARKMKNDGVEINIIMKYTGLSKKEIEKL